VKKHLSRIYLAIILVFMYMPIVTLIIFSFNDSRSMASWTGFTLKWYGELFTDAEVGEAVFVTLTIALIATLVATVIGTMAAIGIDRMQKKRKHIVLNLTYIPMVNADIVLGISLLLLFIFLNIPRGYLTMLLAHITFCIPYVILSVLPKLTQMNPQTYEAALDMGASQSYAMRKVVVPQIMPGILTGAMIAFTMSFDDFVISFFTAQGATENLSTHIYAMARVGINPSINALSAIMFVVVICLLLLINFRVNRSMSKTVKGAAR